MGQPNRCYVPSKEHTGYGPSGARLFALILCLAVLGQNLPGAMAQGRSMERVHGTRLDDPWPWFAESRLQVIGPEKGLLSDQIYALAETDDGGIWLATAGGLYRFDGVHAHPFPATDAMEQKGPGEHPVAHASDARPLPSASILSIMADGPLLWVGFRNDGLYLVHTGTGRHRRIWPGTTPIGGEPPKAVAQDDLPGVVALSKTPDGRVWAAVEDGTMIRCPDFTQEMALFSPEAKTGTEVQSPPPEAYPLSAIQAPGFNLRGTALQPDPLDPWTLFASSNRGVVAYNTKTDSARLYRNPADSIKSLRYLNHACSVLAEDSVLWMASFQHGLQCMYRATGTWEQWDVEPDRSQWQPNTAVWVGPEEGRWRLVGTRANGLVAVDTASGRLLRLQPERSSLHRLSIYQMLEARSGIRYFASNQGLLAMDPQDHQFRYMPWRARVAIDPRDAEIRSVCEDPHQNRLLLCTAQGDGLVVLDGRTGALLDEVHRVRMPDGQWQAADPSQCHPLPNGGYWLSSKQGLLEWDGSSPYMVPWRHADRVSGMGYGTMASRDPEKGFWFAGNGTLLYWRDEQGNPLRIWSLDKRQATVPDGLGAVRDLPAAAPNGWRWMAAQGGILGAHPDSSWLCFVSLDIGTVYRSCGTREGLWLGSLDQGLWHIPWTALQQDRLEQHPSQSQGNKTDRSKTAIRTATLGRQALEAIPFPHREVFMLHAHQSASGESIWISCGAGIVHLNPNNRRWKSFGIREGLHEGWLRWRRTSIGPGGTLYLGLYNGFNYAHVDSLLNASSAARSATWRWEAFRAGSAKVDTTGSSPGHVPWRIPHFNGALELGARLSGIQQPDRIRYQARLLGLDSVWRPLDPNHRVLYAALKPGRYRWQLRALDHDAQPVLEPLDQALILLPAWYQRRDVQALALLFLVALAYAAYRRRIHRIQMEAAQRSEWERRLASSEMSALRAQMHPHFLFNCLTSIQHTMLHRDPVEATRYLGKFSRLIRLILQHARNPTVTLEQELQAVLLYAELERWRFDRDLNIEYRCQPPGADADFRIPSMIIQPYVENAIAHGLLPKAGTGTLRIRAERLSGEGEHMGMRVSVEDDGIGRQAAQQQQAQSDTSRRHQSLGMQINAQRLDLAERICGIRTSVHIEDLHADGRALGTRVVLEFWPLSGSAQDLPPLNNANPISILP